MDHHKLDIGLIIQHPNEFLKLGSLFALKMYAYHLGAYHLEH